MTLGMLFNKPEPREIGSIGFLVFKLSYEHFEDALVLGKWLSSLDLENLKFADLEDVRKGTAERAALDRTIASCLAVDHASGADNSGDVPRLTPSDVADMPIVMLGEALIVVMEINADFFFQTVPRLAQTMGRIRSTGSALLSSLSARVIPTATSADTR